MVRAAIGLGSNLGDRLGLLRTGLEGLATLGTVLEVSSLYETAPVGGPDQGAYLNAVALIETDIEAGDLLIVLRQIEARGGRVRQERWGPRTLDLDLIAYDEVSFDRPDLELPHPRAHERRFVLAPLVEVWPEAKLRSGTASEALDNVAQQPIRLLASKWREGVPEFLGRGAGWVVVQGLLLVLWATVFATSAVFPPRGWMWAGAPLLVVGAWLALASVPTLGRGLTVFPVPNQYGRLTTSGPYGWVRHPMYGGIFLGVLGASILGGSWEAFGVSAILFVYFDSKSRHEEDFLRIVYPNYLDYSEAVPRRLLPWII